MKEIYLTLESWIKESVKKPINIGDDEYHFNIIKKFSSEELLKFEIENKIKLPNQYKEFLLNIGAVELFLSDYSAGIEIISPYNVKIFSENIFNNYGNNPYPNIFIPVNILSTGWFGGFDLTQGHENNFAIFFPEVPPDLWVEEATFTTFNDWLKKLVNSNGEEFS